MVDYASQATTYADDQQAILNGHARLLEMLDDLVAVPCTDEQACNRAKIGVVESYMDNFDVQGMLSVFHDLV